MKFDIPSVLSELYAIDPKLKAHEAELIPLIKTLLENAPDAKPDKAFVKSLRALLKERVASVNAENSSPSFFSSFFMLHYSYAVVGAVLGILVAAPTVYYVAEQTGTPPSIEEGVSFSDAFKYSVTPAGNNAFGDISEMGQGGVADPSISARSRPQSGGGGGVAAPSALMTDNAVAEPGVDAKMIAPYPYTVYNYTYSGAITLDDATVDVFKRRRGISGPNAGGLSSADLGILDVGSFPGMQMESYNLYQDSTKGYYVSVNLKDGSVNVYQNWETWPNPLANCSTDECYRASQLRPDQMPSDEDAIAIANAFLNDHGVSLQNTGDPVVDNNWRQQYELASDKSTAYLPDQISVIYPFEIEGKTTYEQGGTLAGLSVMISVRDKSVTSIWNLFAQSYDSSEYPGVTDTQQVLEYMSRYGKPNPEFMPRDMETTTVDVQLGDPVEGLVRMYNYHNNMSEELFVPALIFPVINGTNDPMQYMPQNFIVPLAKDLLEQSLEGGGPIIMY